MLTLVIWPSMVLLEWTETKLWTLKFGSKSIQTSLILRQRPPKSYKLLQILWFPWYCLFSSQLFSNSRCMARFYGCHKVDYLVLGDAVSKLETFVWILNWYFKVHNLVSIHPKSIIFGQMTNVNMIFHVMVSDYRLVKIWNSPQFPAEFRNGQSGGRHSDSLFCPV